MPMNFETITLEKQDAYQKRLALCKPIASDYSIINLWGFGPNYGLEWAWDENLVWIRQNVPEKQLWAPIGDWAAVNWPAAMDKARGMAGRMIRVPEALVQAMGDLSVNALESRGHWDYLYKREDLVGLKGNRFHKKKNLVSQFYRSYDSVCIPFGPEMIDRASSMQDDWCAWRDCESDDTLAAENNAIKCILKHWRSFRGICGAALRVGEKLVAYTIGETMADRSLVIHFEKGDPEYKGSYQAINQAFLEKMPQEYEIVNRQQDLDSEGLRKAKLSYNPFDFVRKYRIEF